MEEKPKYSFIEKVIGVLFLVSFVVTMLTGLLAIDWLKSNDKLWIWLSMFGFTFFSVGLVIMLDYKKSNKKHEKPMKFFGLFIFLLVGLGLFTLSIMYGLGYTDLVMTLVPILGVAIFPIVGIIMSISQLVRYWYYNTLFTQEVQAEVIDKIEKTHISSSRSHSRSRSVSRVHREYFLTWRYYAQGDWRVWKSDIGRESEPRDIGDCGILLINPESPDDAYDKIAESSELGKVLVISVMFIVFGIIGLLVAFGIIG